MWARFRLNTLKNLKRCSRGLNQVTHRNHCTTYNGRLKENRILANIDDASVAVLKVYQLQNPDGHATWLNKPEPRVGGSKAVSIAEQASINVKEKDEFDTFGEHVATSIRNIQEKYKQANAKYQINNLLYKTEIEQYNRPSEHLNEILSRSTLTTTEPLENRNEDKNFDTVNEDPFMT